MGYKKLKGSQSIIGIDQSANGTAAIILKNGKIHAKMFYADSLKDYKKFKNEGALKPVTVQKNDEQQSLNRLIDLRDNFRQFIERYRPNYAAFEYYSINKAAYNERLGEVGGLIRLELARAKIPFHYYDVSVVKIFATDDGHAEKADIVLACKFKWNEDFLIYGKTNKAAGNLADAYTIAKILETELRLRSGKLTLENIPANERRVFLRTTKQCPVNILDMQFVKV